MKIKDYPEEIDGEKKAKHRVERDGDRDISFTGWLIGTGTHGTGGNSGYAGDWTRGVDVNIYLTTGGNLIAAVKRWSRWQGESDQCAAEVLSDGDAVLDWLKSDTQDGRLGPASKEAWEMACKAVPELEGEDVEEIA